MEAGNEFGFLTEEIQRYFLDHGKVLPREILETLGKNPLDLTAREKELYVKFILPRRRQIKRALKARFIYGGARRDVWLSRLQSCSQSIAGQIAVEMLIEEESLSDEAPVASGQMPPPPAGKTLRPERLGKAETSTPPEATFTSEPPATPAPTAVQGAPLPETPLPPELLAPVEPEVPEPTLPQAPLGEPTLPLDLTLSPEPVVPKARSFSETPLPPGLISTPGMPLSTPPSPHRPSAADKPPSRPWRTRPSRSSGARVETQGPTGVVAQQARKVSTQEVSAGVPAGEEKLSGSELTKRIWSFIFPENTDFETCEEVNRRKSRRKTVFYIGCGAFMGAILLLAVIGLTAGQGGKWKEAESKVAGETTLPLEVENPAPGESFNNPALTVRGKTAPYAEVTVSVEGSGSVSCKSDAAGYFSADILLAEGENRLTVTATSGGASRTMTLSCAHVLDPAAYKARCEKIDFDSLSLNPDAFMGRKYCVTGSIDRITESDGTTEILLNVTRNKYGVWSDTVCVLYEGKVSARRFSLITVYGEIQGSYSATTAAGKRVTLPLVKAKYVEVVQR